MRLYEKVTPWTSTFTFKKIACMVVPNTTVHVYDQTAGPPRRLADAPPLEVGEAIDKAIRQMAHARGLDLTENYKALFDEVMDKSPSAKTAYARVPARAHQRGPGDLSGGGSVISQRPAGVVVDERARERMRADAGLRYADAMKLVLDDDPELAACYALGPGVGYPRLRKGGR